MTTHKPTATTNDAPKQDALVSEDLLDEVVSEDLIEEVSIDGMCGVY